MSDTENKIEEAKEYYNSNSMTWDFNMQRL